MPSKHSVKRITYSISLFFLGVVCSAWMMSASEKYTAGATEGETSNATLAPISTSSGNSAAAAETTTNCTPIRVAAFKNRVHVQCSSAVGGISFFAAPTSDPQNAARILSLISTAQVAGRNLLIWYDPANTSGASFGCQTKDCRIINGVAFGQ